MRRKRVSQATSAASSSKWRCAAGSRSMQTSVPVGPSRPATRRAWPPAPKVQSTAVSPGAGDVRSISSPARTGTWTRLMSRRIAKALRHLPDLGVEGLLLLLPALPRPDLEMVPHADHHDLLLDARVREERRRQRRAAARVEVDLEGVALEEARHLAVLRAHRVQAAQRALDDRLVGLRSPDGDAGLRRLGENRSVREGGAEPGRNAEPVLGVQRMLEVASECQRSCPCAWFPSRAHPAKPGASGLEEKIWTGVAEWEEPRHSGRLLAATVPHFLPPSNTFSHFSVRLDACPMPNALQKRESAGSGAASRRPFLQFALHGQGRVPQPRWGSGGCNGGKRTRRTGGPNLM